MPSLPTDEREPFDDERYIFEPMIDGHRLVLSMENGIVRLFTRHGNDVTRQYPELHRVPVDDNSDVVLDGEVACIDAATGAIDPERMMERYRLNRPMAIREASVVNPVHFFVFDILRYKGNDVRSLALADRKRLLAEALTPNRWFSPMPTFEQFGQSLFEAVRKLGLEGIVAKRKDGTYTGKRDDGWKKVINYEYAVAAIAGYRKNQFGWLLRLDGGGEFVIAADVPQPYRNAFAGVASAIRTGEDRNFVYVQPAVRARIRFRGRKPDGSPRHPEFVDFAI